MDFLPSCKRQKTLLPTHGTIRLGHTDSDLDLGLAVTVGAMSNHFTFLVFRVFLSKVELLPLLLTLFSGVWWSLPSLEADLVYSGHCSPNSVALKYLLYRKGNHSYITWWCEAVMALYVK